MLVGLSNRCQKSTEGPFDWILYSQIGGFRPYFNILMVHIFWYKYAQMDPVTQELNYPEMAMNLHVIGRMKWIIWPKRM